MAKEIPKIDLPEASTTPAGSVSAPTESKFAFPSFNKRWLWVVLGFIAVFFVFVVVPFVAVAASGKKAVDSVKKLQVAFQNQNLGEIKTSLTATKKELAALNRETGIFVWMRAVPFVSGYWSDLRHATVASIAGVEAAELVLVTVEPYADILGFDGGEQATDGQKTAEDRINFIVESIDDIIPKLDEISAKTEVLATEASKINPKRYPGYLAGKEIQSKIRKAIDWATQAHELITDGKPVLEKLPYTLGIEGQRTYLILWQNDKEIRPTGGFITAYSIIKVKDGKIEQVVSDDIYKLDDKFRSRIPAPEPIVKYLPLVPYWNLRDMNLSPDFKVSMDTFSQHYETIKSAYQFDGIVAVDTYLLVDLLQVMGTLGVPGFGNYSADEDPRCNCPGVIYELESFADVAGPIVWDDISGKIVYKPPHADNRKAFLGPLMNTLVANAMGQPKDKLPDLFAAGWRSITEKHVMFYFKDQDVQNAMESFNLAGRLVDFDGDYLHVNDTNFAGAKSNLYVQHEVELKVDTGRDGTTNHLTIKYKNPQKYDGWLNGPFRNWFRIYVPKGSTLGDSTGSEVEVSTYEDLGKTVFEGFFILRPQGVTELNIKYKTPVKVKMGQEYKLLVQKQPGTEGHQYTVTVGKRKEEFKLIKDKELRF